MKSFTNFLIEEWGESWFGKHHIQKMSDDHYVKVRFDDQGSSDGKYAVHFDILNNHGERSSIPFMNKEREWRKKPLISGTEALDHVKKIIHEFIRKHKPTYLRFDPDNKETKGELYYKFAQSLAKQYGGVANKRWIGSSEVTFKNLKENWQKRGPGLNEAYLRDVIAHGGVSEIHKNPSRNDIFKLMHKSEFGEARGLIHDNDIYVWSSAYHGALHGDVALHLNLVGPRQEIFFRKHPNHPNKIYLDKAWDHVYLPEDHPWIVRNRNHLDLRAARNR